MTHTPEQIAKLTSCPKCGLEAKTLLHPFCTHAECPIRSSIKKEKPSHTDEPWQQKHGEDIEGATTIIANADAEIDSEGTHYSYETVAVCRDQFDECLPEAQANARRIVACVNALSGISTEAIEAGGVQELAEALREIRDMKPREYTGPEFDREASDACPDCIKYQGHPIQQGICDEHRRPFYAREDHDKFEERAKGSRCYLIASAALSKWEASK